MGFVPIAAGCESKSEGREILAFKLSAQDAGADRRLQLALHEVGTLRLTLKDTAIVTRLDGKLMLLVYKEGTTKPSRDLAEHDIHSLMPNATTTTRLVARDESKTETRLLYVIDVSGNVPGEFEDYFWLQFFDYCRLPLDEQNWNIVHAVELTLKTREILALRTRAWIARATMRES